MRALSSALRPVMSPAPGRTAAAERPAPAGEAAARSPRSTGGPTAAARPIARKGCAARGNPPVPAPPQSLPLLRSPHNHDEPDHQQQDNQRERGKVLGSAWLLSLGGATLEILRVA